MQGKDFAVFFTDRPLVFGGAEPADGTWV